MEHGCICSEFSTRRPHAQLSSGLRSTASKRPSRSGARLKASSCWRSDRRSAELRAAIGELEEIQTKQLRLSRAGYDDLGRLREKLIALRRSDGYAATFENRHPLVSVPIATFNAAEVLVDRAIASVRAQTYDRWEIVVVGDGCTDDTAARVARLDDRRIRFVNLPFRTTVFPPGRHERWQISGVAPWNRAIELSQGEWLAPLDDDDEFLPNHMETLLDLALERRAEYAYGKLEVAAEPGAGQYIFSFPPEMGQIGLQQAIYLRGLSFFECDAYSWAMEEPADWNLIRRMREAGVHMAATEEPVARHYPSRESVRFLPRRRRMLTTETSFIDDVLRAIVANRDAVIDNPIIDRCRFPTQTFEPSSPSSILEAVAYLLDRRHEYERAANLFADEESVSLYRELLIFRALGPLRYALPLSTPGYIDLYREEQAFRIADSTRQLPPWPLSIFRIEFFGHSIKLEVWDGDLTAYFLLRQYFFDRGGVRIQPDRGDVVLDLGACLGDTALGFAAAVGQSGRVFAFEPMPIFQEAVRSNVERNPQLAARIELVDRVVSSTSDQLVRLVDDGPASRMSADGAVEAMTVSVDDFVDTNGLERVDFIKMDVEGAEQLALEGSAHSIASHRPKLAICAYHEPDDLWRIPLLITRLNPHYRLYLDHYTNHLEETVIYAV